MAYATSPTPPREIVDVPLRHVVVPVGLVVLVYLRWRYRLTMGLGTIGVLSLALVYFGLPLVVRRLARRFDENLLRLLGTGQREALLPYYRGRYVLRAIASQSFMLSRLGWIRWERGEPEKAAAAYREALDALGPTRGAERDRVVGGLVNALYATADDAGAEPLYRELVDHDSPVLDVYHNLAHGLVRRETGLDEALKLCKRGLDLAGGDGPTAVPFYLTQAEALLGKGDRDAAKRALDSAGRAGPPSGPNADRRARIAETLRA